MFIRSKMPGGHQLHVIRAALSIKSRINDQLSSQASRNSTYKSKDCQAERRATTHGPKRWRSAEHGMTLMAKMPQALESEDSKRVGK